MQLNNQELLKGKKFIMNKVFMVDRILPKIVNVTAITNNARFSLSKRIPNLIVSNILRRELLRFLLIAS